MTEHKPRCGPWGGMHSVGKREMKAAGWTAYGTHWQYVCMAGHLRHPMMMMVTSAAHAPHSSRGSAAWHYRRAHAFHCTALPHAHTLPRPVGSSPACFIFAAAAVPAPAPAAVIPVVSDGISARPAGRTSKELDPSEKILALKKELGVKDGRCGAAGCEAVRCDAACAAHSCTCLDGVRCKRMR